MKTLLMIVISLAFVSCGKVRYVNNDTAGANADQVGQAGKQGESGPSEFGNDAGDNTGETAGETGAEGATAGGTAGDTAGDTAGGDTAGDTAGGDTAGGPTPTPTAMLTAIAFEPTSLTLPTGLDHYFKVIGTYDDGTTADITDNTDLKFEASVNDVIRIIGVNYSYLGVRALAPGEVELIAKLDDLTATADITVVDVNFVDFRLDPNMATIKMGEIETRVAVGVGDTGDEYNVSFNTDFTSADPDIAKVGDEIFNKGIVTGVEVGSTNVTASFMTFTAEADIEVLLGDGIDLVSLTIVNPDGSTVADPVVPKGGTREFAALGKYSDDKERMIADAMVMWSSSAAAVFTVDANGVVTGIDPGSADLIAKVGDIMGSLTLQVQIFKATDKFAVESTPALLDMIFVIDNSPSMRKSIQNVENNINAFANFIASKSDVKVHIVSAKTTPVIISSTTGMPLPSLYFPLTAPENEQITQYDVLIDSGDVAIAAAVASCPSDANFFAEGAASKICETPVTNIYGVDQQFTYGITPEFDEKNSMNLFDQLNGILTANLRPKSKRVYVMITNSDIITQGDLSAGTKTIDHNNFAEAVGQYSYDYPTVFSIAKLPGYLDCPFSEDAIDLMSLSAATMGMSYDLCEVDWTDNFDDLAKDTLALKDNIFTLSQDNILEIISVSQNGKVIDPSNYKVNGNVITVYPSAVDISGAAPDLEVEYLYAP